MSCQINGNKLKYMLFLAQFNNSLRKIKKKYNDCFLRIFHVFFNFLSYRDGITGEVSV